MLRFWIQYQYQVLNSAGFAEVDAPGTSQASHQSRNKDIATLK